MGYSAEDPLARSKQIRFKVTRCLSISAWLCDGVVHPHLQINYKTILVLPDSFDNAPDKSFIKLQYDPEWDQYLKEFDN